VTGGLSISKSAFARGRVENEASPATLHDRLGQQAVKEEILDSDPKMLGIA
jgi:hypothetical protein